MQDSAISLFRNAKSFFSGTLASRLSGLARDVSMAFCFGTEASVAAFFVAFRLAHLLRRLLGEGALQAAFIPNFEKLKAYKQQKEGQFFIDLYGSLTIALICLIIIAIGLLAFLLHTSHMPSGNDEIILFCMLMLPSALFICLFGLNASLLQCEKYYFLPGFAPVVFNIIWLLALPLIKDWPVKEAMMALSLTISVACIGQWLITMPKTMHIIKHTYGQNFSYKHCKPFSLDVRALFMPLLLGITGVAATQINSALDLFFARYADIAGPAYLWYAIRIEQLPLALFGIALSSALLPPLSRAIKEGAYSRYLDLLSSSVSQCMSLMLPLNAALFILAESGITLLYGYGDFDQHSIRETTYCLWGYGCGLMLQALTLLVVPAFYATSNYAIPTKATLWAVLSNIVLNFVMVFGFHWGAFSISIATSLCAFINLIFLILNLEENSGLNAQQTAPKALLKGLHQGFYQAGLGTSLAVSSTLIIDYHISFTNPLFHFTALAMPFGVYFVWTLRHTLRLQLIRH